MPARAADSGPPFSCLPSISIAPVRETVPEIARSVVVLPAPFAPRTETTSPSAHGQRHAVQRLHGAVARVDVVELEQRPAHSSVSGSTRVGASLSASGSFASVRGSSSSPTSSLPR